MPLGGTSCMESRGCIRLVAGCSAGQRYGWFHCSEQPQERGDESRGSGALTSSLVLLDLKERFPNPKRWLTARNKTQCINILVFQNAPQSPAVMLIECDLYQGE